MTPTGPATVTTDGPVIDGKQEVTITTTDGSTTTAIADVTPTSNGKNELEIPGPDGTTTTVTVPSTSTGSGYGGYPTEHQTGTEGLPSVEIDTAAGFWTVLFNGPVTPERTQSITILKHDGSSPEKRTVDVLEYTDGSLWVEVPLGPGESPRRIPIPVRESEYGTATTTTTTTTVSVMTPTGPATVTTDGPVIDGKQEVTITTTDGSTTTAIADVTPTSNGKNELEIPGPDGTTTTVTVPSTSTGSGYGGYPTEHQTGTEGLPSVEIDTAAGFWTVLFNGPVTPERTQSITILKHDGSSPEKRTVDVLEYTDGSLWVEVPLGPGESPRRIPIPVRESEYGTATTTTTTTTVSVMTPTGPATVTTDGPVIDGKQEVTITTTDGSTTTAIADVTPTSNGKNELEIPGPDGTTTTVTVPSTSTGSGYGGYPTEHQTGTEGLPSVEIDTAAGFWTVLFNGPVTPERTQSITILKHDGSSPEKRTVDVLEYTDGSLWVEVPLGPGESPRRIPIPVRESEYGTATTTTTTTTVSVINPTGPATVTTDGPVIDGKQEVTITTTDGSTTTAIADVTPTSNGKSELEIPGPDGTTTTVTVPSTSTGSGYGGYSTEHQTGTEGLPSVEIDTAAGFWTVLFNGPVTPERTQSITILKHDGSSPEKRTVDVLEYTDGSLWVEVPLGPGESPRRIPIPVRESEYGTATTTTTTTTVSVINPTGPATVTTDGPVIDGKQEVTITTTDGSTTTAIADVTPTSNGKSELEIPGPDGTTTTVTVPSTSTGSGYGGYPTEHQTGTEGLPSVEIDTAAGFWTVLFNGPVTPERTQSITILKHDGSSPEKRTVDVLEYTDGSLWVEVPLGPGERPRRIPIPVRESEYGTATTTTTTMVSVMTPTGPATVTTDGPVIDSKQEVTITTTDGSTTTAIADVTPTSNGKNELEIPGPDGTTTTVTAPSTSTGSGYGGYPTEHQTGTEGLPSVEIDTAAGFWTVLFNGPVTPERTQSITILKHDGSSPEKRTVDVLEYTDGSLWVEVPLGPGESPRRNTIPVRESEYGTATATTTTTTVSVMTLTGPATVTTDGPVIDGKQEVTITTTYGSTTTAIADVTPTSNGKSELEIPGPDGTTTTVTVPSTLTGSGYGGYPTEHQTGTEGLPSVEIDTAAGFWTVQFNGPVTPERTQSITILKHDGSSPEKRTVDVLEYTDGSLWVEVPLGPGESPRGFRFQSVRVNTAHGHGRTTTTTTTVSVMTPTGPATVTTDGPVIDGKQEVTITTTDGSTTTAIADVTPTSNGKSELEIPGPDGTTTTVTVPSTSTGSGYGGYPTEHQTGTEGLPSVEIDTAAGFWTVQFNGPVTPERTQSITILKHDGSSPEKRTVDVLEYTDGSLWVEVPLGPGESPRRIPIPVRESEYGTATMTTTTTTTTVSVMTLTGPATVTTDGPVIDGKQEVTITTTDGSTTTAIADVTPTSNGKSELEIPGPDGTTTTVTVSSTSTGSGYGGYPTEHQTGTEGLPSFNGPVTPERTQSITILKHDGSSPEKRTVDVLEYTDGSLWVEVPLGPGESPRRKTIPVRESEYGTATARTTTTTTTTTVSVMTLTGPATVTTDGPVIDGKQEVTITTTYGSTTTAIADVTPTSNGKNKLEIPGPDGTTTTVTVPSTSTGSGYGGYPTEHQTGTEGLPSFNGPVTGERTQSITILKHDGSSPEKRTVDVLEYTDGPLWVEVPLGPGESPRRIPIPVRESEYGTATTTTTTAVSVMTPTGPATVTTDGPVIDGKQEVTITTTDGSTTTAIADVTPTSNGKNELEIPGPDGTTTTVTVPSTSTESGYGGYPTEHQTGTEGLPSSITILKHDGSSPEKRTVDVLEYTDGSLWVEVPLGPGESPRRIPIPVRESEYGTATTTTTTTTTVSVMTPTGPATVTTDGPVIDGKQEVTITTTDGSTTTAIADVTPTSNGKSELEIPGPDGTTTTVTVPSTSTGSGYGGYPTEHQTGTEELPSVEIDTAPGFWTVLFNGPVTPERTQSITILKHDGSSLEKRTVDVLEYTDGSLWVEVPLGPGESPRQIPIPVHESEYGTATTTTVSVMTPTGPATVTTDGPVIDGKQEVTITTTDGSTTTAIADVTPTSNGKSELEIPGPDGTTTTVTVPSTSTGSGYGGYPTEHQTGTEGLPSVEIDTAPGFWTVLFNGPVTPERTQSITILKHDGSSLEKRTVDVLEYTDGSLWVEVPLGPGESPRQIPIPVHESEYGTATATATKTTTTTTTTVSVMTPMGPATVTTDGPVIDGKQEVTITTTDGSTTTAIADVTPTSNGKSELEIPGPDGTTTTVTVPSTSTGSGYGGYPTEHQTGTEGLPSVEIDTAAGFWTVLFNGPVTPERTQSITIRKHDGSSPEKRTVDVLEYTDGSLWVEVPLGPGESPRRIPIPVHESEYGTATTTTTTTTTVSVMTPTGPATVTTDGPVIDGKQEVTITTTDGSTTTAIADVTPTSNGKSELEIPGPDGTTTTVTVPSTSTGSGYGGYPTEHQTGTEGLPSVEIDTAPGFWTVLFNGPVTPERTQSITIRKHDGSSLEKRTVDVLEYTDGSLWVEVPLGPGESPRQIPIPVHESEYGTATATATKTTTTTTTTVSVMTPTGPATVTTDGPVIDGKQEVTITTTDGSTTTAIADVTPTSNGKNELEIPSPNGTTTTVTVSSTSTGSGYGGYPTEHQTGTEGLPSVEIDTAAGFWTVLFNGPVTPERTQSITIRKHDGSSPEKRTVDVLEYTDGSLWVEVPLGRGESPRQIPIPVRESEYGTATTTTTTAVSVMTPTGPATVTTDGPVIDGKQEVTITTTDGSTTTAIADVTPTSNGKSELEIPGPDGTTTTVTVPSTSTGSGYGGYPTEHQTGTEGLPSVKIDTTAGFWTVFFDGPVNDGLQHVKLQKHDGSTSVMTLFVNYRADDKKTVEIPTGPGDQTTTVFVPEWQVEPGQVTTDSAVLDGKQLVTITTPDGKTTTTTVEVTSTSDGKNALKIPTGPEGQSMIVTIPQPPSAGSTGGSGTVPQSSNPAPAPEVVVDTPQGPATVTITGPVVDNKQVVTITTPDGGATTTSVNVTKTRGGKTELEIPTGEGSTTTVSVPSTTTQEGGGHTTTDILNQLGGNDIDNGDKDFMSKDEFQLQIGAHFSDKIMALKQQTKDEEAQSDKLLDQQKELQDCILQAANKFGYYGVYEQPPYFKNAVHWVDKDCLRQ
ncbi:hypothetical protein PInf_015554 [Phytophthora infestans]|nr:hypothetical protein PInf_015554 [Phytophthora infestans]